ncbi:alanyl-tRNA editing protein [Pseudothioclava nitratireducens]|uniref:alanyl-tRNA editing protein n=1 Tax=Pseudothioclava nitratireducens TaxID=1928646 RepID=UPI0023DC1538|nr:alanyl-tRNA editing protein [Defluviimonas nitratireducens]MDF1621358.1 alanyl-tRNA editing protein [Defluviimonas nitratireducens]
MQGQMYRLQPYARELVTEVVGHTPEGGVLCADSIFYPTGGGQPGDAGTLVWAGGALEVATAIKAPENAPAPVILVPAEPAPLPPVGTQVTQSLDWERRHRHMRVHTALHLLSVVIPLPVSGGAIGTEKGRLDFDMPEPPEDISAIDARLNAMIAADLQVREEWISDEELAANPGLVKTMSVAPPTGQGWVRLIRIGEGAAQVDLQPCGGTHVASTAEIGPVRIGKLEKKGKRNRRVSLHLA